MKRQGPKRGRESAKKREPQQARSRATRSQVIQATADLIEKQGYERTSMTEIAAQAGIGIGTLYHHFPDQRSILLELIDEWSERIAAGRRSIVQLEALIKGGEARAAVASILRRTYELLQRQHWIHAEIFRLLDRDEEVRRRYQNLERVNAERFAAMIEFGQERGVLRREPDPLIASFLMLNTLELLMSHVLRMQPMGTDPERMLQEMTDMLCRYLVQDP
jgi:AcrR family transcriptional regulator